MGSCPMTLTGHPRQSHGTMPTACLHCLFALLLACDACCPLACVRACIRVLCCFYRFAGVLGLAAKAGAACLTPRLVLSSTAILMWSPLRSPKQHDAGVGLMPTRSCNILRHSVMSDACFSNHDMSKFMLLLPTRHRCIENNNGCPLYPQATMASLTVFLSYDIHLPNGRSDDADDCNVFQV